MNSVTVRNVEIGVGRPKICVPIVGENVDEIIFSAKNILKKPVDIIEWRVDWFQDVFNHDKLIAAAKKLRDTVKDVAVLFTFRTAAEGGERAISKEDYEELNKAIISSGYVDLVDVEVFMDEELCKRVCEFAKENGVKVIGSNHDFDKTPAKDEIVDRLKHMQKVGVDIPKIALMPKDAGDLIMLLCATYEMKSKFADRPIITMSMAGVGVLSRLAGEVFGSALTFGTVGKSSAPGQMDVDTLNEVMDIIHKSLS